MADSNPRITVVIPVFNEIATLEAIVARVHAQPLPVDIVAVDDGSTDGSRALLEQLAAAGRLTALFHERNRGKGAAVRTGMAAARGDIVLVQDADLEYDPADYPRLVQPITDGHADVVYGSRFAGGEAHRVLYFWHYVVNRGLTLLSNAVSGINLSDMETCYKVIRRETLERIELRENRFGFDPEITILAARAGARFYEVGITYHGRTYEQGKKIGWRDGLAVLCAIFVHGVLRRVTGGGLKRRH